MRFNEFNHGLQTFMASVRVKCGTSSVMARTTIDAESQSQAKALLCHLYGANNALSITQAISEEGNKVTSAEELRVKAMSDQAKRLNQQAKQLKARNAVQKAQSQLNKAFAPIN